MDTPGFGSRLVITSQCRTSDILWRIRVRATRQTWLMLNSYKLVAFLAVKNADTARAFYRDKLGLELVSDDQFALVFNANGTTLRVVPVGEIPEVRWTVLGWEVPDIVAAAEKLENGGVKLERFEWLKPEEKKTGIWNAPGGDKVAWFKDPDGNTLSISQHAPRS